MLPGECSPVAENLVIVAQEKGLGAGAGKGRTNGQPVAIEPGGHDEDVASNGQKQGKRQGAEAERIYKLGEGQTSEVSNRAFFRLKNCSSQRI